nr:hypothetical protein [Mycoplasmopsis bovis]
MDVSCHTTDVFYSIRSLEETINKTKCQVVDNECFGLFTTAKRCNKKAAALLSVSENIVTVKSMTSVWKVIRIFLQNVWSCS